LTDETIVAFCKDQLSRAQQLIENIRKGEMHFIGSSGGQMTDVTKARQAHYVKMVERLQKIIAAYEEQNA
jgi:exonuclease VII small subunit